jgi:hypothetical protein
MLAVAEVFRTYFFASFLLDFVKSEYGASAASDSQRLAGE